MEAEAAPTIKKLALQVLPTVFPSALPYQCYTDSTKSLYLVTSGKDATHAVDNVGTMHAALAVSTALMALPDIKVIVNAGTCGGFIKRGCKIGTVVIPTKGAFHDRRIVIPSTPFEQYGIGATDLTSCAIANEVREKLGYLGGCCSSGDSLDHSKEDDEIMEGNEAVVKCMEFAAISQVAKMWGKVRGARGGVEEGGGARCRYLFCAPSVYISVSRYSSPHSRPLLTCLASPIPPHPPPLHRGSCWREGSYRSGRRRQARLRGVHGEFEFRGRGLASLHTAGVGDHQEGGVI